jgi:hypothetical protein
MKRIAGLAALLAAALLTVPAYAVTADGITYTLENPNDNNFIVHITGINTIGDTEGGRASVNAFAFSTTGFNITGGTTPGGTFLVGGLNSTGCNGSGGFFCFDVNIPVAGSTLDIPFHLDSTNLAGWAAATAFKIDWIGSKNNYDLVSAPFGVNTPSDVPIPGAVWLFGGALTGLALLRRKQKKMLTGQAA